jgi:hypothetical protein
MWRITGSNLLKLYHYYVYLCSITFRLCVNSKIPPIFLPTGKKTLESLTTLTSLDKCMCYTPAIIYLT